MSLSDLLSGSLTPDNIAAIASRMGVDNAQAKKALWVALPALINGLKKNTETPEGAEALSNALDAHGNDDENIVDVVTNGRAKKGDKIANHILGNSTSEIIQAMAEKAGLDSTKANSLLEGLGPVVMGALGKTKKNQNLSAGDLSSLLSWEAGSFAKIVGKFFDQDGDGDFDLNDGLKLAMNFLKK